MKCPICKKAKLKQDNGKENISFECPDCYFNEGHFQEARNYIYCMLEISRSLEDHPALVADNLLEKVKKAESLLQKAYHQCGQWVDQKKWKHQ